MIFVFDRELHTVPDEGHLRTGFYYEKSQYMSNVASGNEVAGFLGHGSLFIDIFKSKTEFKTILTDNITDETDLLYVIEPWPLFNGVKEKKGFENVANPANWNRTLDFIPKKILWLAKDKRLTILFHIPEYSTGLHVIRKSLDNRIETLKIPPSQIKFISGIKYDSWYYWPSFEYSQLVNYVHGDETVKSVNLSRRKKKYTFLNRVDKGHRRYVAINLWKRGLQTDGYFSYSFARFAFEKGKYELKRGGCEEKPYEFNPVNWELTYDEWKKFYKMGPWTADKLTLEEHNNHWHVEPQHYNDAYWNFVTETGVTTHTFLSEKTFKPIANLQPFVIIGSMHSLRLLRELGYKTFGKFIDESYDDIKNSDTRIKSATRQAIKLAQMSHEEHIKLITQLKPILEHNQKHFFSSKNRIENFVKYIYGNNPDYNWLKDCKYA